mgnify:CR=1 FL=1
MFSSCSTAPRQPPQSAPPTTTKPLAEPPVAAVTDNTAYVSTILDTANYGSAEFVGIFGSQKLSDTVKA